MSEKRDKVSTKQYNTTYYICFKINASIMEDNLSKRPGENLRGKRRIFGGFTLHKLDFVNLCEW